MCLSSVALRANGIPKGTQSLVGNAGPAAKVISQFSRRVVWPLILAFR